MYTYAYIYTSIYKYINTYIRIYMYIYTYAYIYKYLSICTFTYMYAYIYIHAYTHWRKIYAYIYIYIHIYTSHTPRATQHLMHTRGNATVYFKNESCLHIMSHVTSTNAWYVTCSISSEATPRLIHTLYILHTYVYILKCLHIHI